MTEPEKALEEMDVSIEKELDTILPGSNPLDNLKAIHEGGLEYSVLSVRDGSPTYHWVTLGDEPSCTCEDYKYNRKEASREVCKHICKAILADQMEPDRLAVRELINVTATVSQAAAEARQAANEARSTARELDNGLVKMRDTQASHAAAEPDMGDSESGIESTDTSGSSEAEEAAAKLQSAFDEVVEGMAVEHNKGMIWVNKTPEAPDTLPGPGNVEIFEVFLQNPDQIEYVHDNHDYNGAEPGQYFRNMIRPENVDDYISEVLE